MVMYPRSKEKNGEKKPVTNSCEVRVVDGVKGRRRRVREKGILGRVCSEKPSREDAGGSSKGGWSGEGGLDQGGGELKVLGR